MQNTVQASTIPRHSEYTGVRAVDDLSSGSRDLANIDCEDYENSSRFRLGRSKTTSPRSLPPVHDPPTAVRGFSTAVNDNLKVGLASRELLELELESVLEA